MQVVEIVTGMASVMESITILQFVSRVTQVTWEKVVTNVASMARLLSHQAEIRVAVAAVTLELTVVRNAMVTASVNRACVFVIADGEGLNVKQLVVQVKGSTAVITAFAYSLHSNAIALMDGKEKVVMSQIAVVYQIAMH